jgi:hypothetical protein
MSPDSNSLPVNALPVNQPPKCEVGALINVPASAKKQHERKPSTHLPPRAHRRLKASVKAFVSGLRRDPELKLVIQRDLGGFRADLQQQIKALFRLRRGARPHPRLDEAYRLMKRGRSAPDVLRLQIPNWDALDTYSKYLMCKALRQAFGRRNQSKKKATKSKAD